MTLDIHQWCATIVLSPVQQCSKTFPVEIGIVSLIVMHSIPPSERSEQPTMLRSSNIFDHSGNTEEPTLLLLVDDIQFNRWHSGITEQLTSIAGCEECLSALPITSRVLLSPMLWAEKRLARKTKVHVASRLRALPAWTNGRRSARAA